MFLRTLFVLAAAALGALGAATAATVDKNATVVVGTKETEFGTLVFYGRADHRAPSVKPRQEECGAPKVQCTQRLAPDAKVCQRLLGFLEEHPEFPFTETTVGVCASFEDDDPGPCCVGWTDPVPGLVAGDLAPVAQSIFDICVADKGQAGYAIPFNLKGVCTMECMSTDGCVDLVP